MKHKRLRQEGGSGKWTRWVQPVRRNYLMACCDCGLCHWMNFRIYKGRVQFQVARAPRYTDRERAKQSRPVLNVAKIVAAIKRVPKKELRKVRVY